MKLTLYSAILFILIGCGNSDKISSTSGTPENVLFPTDTIKPLDDNFENLDPKDITSIDLYCFCFSDSTWRSCNTFVRVSPDALLKTNNLISSISDESRIQKFITNAKTNARITDTIQGQDVRLVAWITTRNQGQKSLAYYSDSVLCYQDKYLIKCNQKVNLMLREAFNLSAIDCE